MRVLQNTLSIKTALSKVIAGPICHVKEVMCLQVPFAELELQLARECFGGQPEFQLA